MTRMSSRPEGFHLRALPEPYVNLSIHTAPDVRPLLSNGFASSKGSSRCQMASVGPWPRLNNAAPSVPLHYRAFVPRKKQPLPPGAGNSLAGQGFERYFIAEVCQAFDQALGLLTF